MQVGEGEKPLTSYQCHHSFRLEEWGSGRDSVGGGHQVGVLGIKCGQWGLGVIGYSEILLNTMLKIMQHQGINVELPLQVGVHLLFHLVDLPECKLALANNT